MNDNYDNSFELVIGSEGGFQNSPKDRGNWTTGKIGFGQNRGTKYGITAMSYPKLDIRGLTLDDAKAIYERDFWATSGAPNLPTGVDYLVFDIGVNHGVDRAKKWLQEAVGVTVDGKVGPRTIAAAQGQDPVKTIRNLSVIRVRFYSALDNETFEKGWLKRAIETTVEAIMMHRDTVYTPVTREPVPLDQSKAEEQKSFFNEWFRRI